MRQLPRHPCIPQISAAGFLHPTDQRTPREEVVASLPTRLSTEWKSAVRSKEYIREYIHHRVKNFFTLCIHLGSKFPLALCMKALTLLTLILPLFTCNSILVPNTFYFLLCFRLLDTDSLVYKSVVSKINENASLMHSSWNFILVEEQLHRHHIVQYALIQYCIGKKTSSRVVTSRFFGCDVTALEKIWRLKREQAGRDGEVGMATGWGDLRR